MARALLLTVMTATLVAGAAGCGNGSTSGSGTPAASSATEAGATTDTGVGSAAATGDYTGTGTKIIGAVDLPNGATAEWSCDGDIFFLIALEGPADMANPQLIVSQGKSGTGYVPPGHYVFKVSTGSGANWALTFHEQ